jgi:hypothetical protein
MNSSWRTSAFEVDKAEKVLDGIFPSVDLPTKVTHPGKEALDFADIRPAVSV